MWACFPLVDLSFVRRAPAEKLEGWRKNFCSPIKAVRPAWDVLAVSAEHVASLGGEARLNEWVRLHEKV